MDDTGTLEPLNFERRQKMAVAQRDLEAGKDGAMMTLLRSLHSIAAARGDGLRPELLEMMTPSATRSDIKRASDAGGNGKASECPAGEEGSRSHQTNVVALPPRKP